MVILLLAGLAAAQEPSEPAEEAPEEATSEEAEPEAASGEEAPDPRTQRVLDPYEITVWGEQRVEQARQEVVRELEELGYDAEVIDRGDRVVYRHAVPYKGEVVLYDDGWMQVKRQPLRVEGREMPWAEQGSPLAWAGCLVYPWLCIRSSGATLSERKWRGIESRTVARVHDEAEVYGDRVADLAVARKLDDLPERLQALWDEGVPLQGEAPVETFAARRAALLAWWESRTDTPWGEAMRSGVEAFVRAVVQTSEHPFTDEEIAAFNAQTTAARPFDPERRVDPWAAIP